MLNTTVAVYLSNTREHITKPYSLGKATNQKLWHLSRKHYYRTGHESIFKVARILSSHNPLITLATPKSCQSPGSWRGGVSGKERKGVAAEACFTHCLGDSDLMRYWIQHSVSFSKDYLPSHKWKLTHEMPNRSFSPCIKDKVETPFLPDMWSWVCLHDVPSFPRLRQWYWTWGHIKPPGLEGKAVLSEEGTSSLATRSVPQRPHPPNPGEPEPVSPSGRMIQ